MDFSLKDTAMVSLQVEGKTDASLFDVGVIRIRVKDAGQGCSCVFVSCCRTSFGPASLDVFPTDVMPNWTNHHSLCHCLLILRKSQVIQVIILLKTSYSSTTSYQYQKNNNK